ncbi:hypothetical protein [Beijerinckia indica]|uniref:hypothetical protein n=1 Tax=Beijerinckia indica TaxID=533 RepID=UPI0011D0DEDD|nr:hypothetical protein [Beijerinckia indica]
MVRQSSLLIPIAASLSSLKAKSGHRFLGNFVRYQRSGALDANWFDCPRLENGKGQPATPQSSRPRLFIFKQTSEAKSCPAQCARPVPGAGLARDGGAMNKAPVFLLNFFSICASRRKMTVESQCNESHLASATARHIPKVVMNDLWFLS